MIAADTVYQVPAATSWRKLEALPKAFGHRPVPELEGTRNLAEGPQGCGASKSSRAQQGPWRPRARRETSPLQRAEVVLEDGMGSAVRSGSTSASPPVKPLPADLRRAARYLRSWIRARRAAP